MVLLFYHNLSLLSFHEKERKVLIVNSKNYKHLLSAYKRLAETVEDACTNVGISVKWKYPINIFEFMKSGNYQSLPVRFFCLK